MINLDLLKNADVDDVRGFYSDRRDWLQAFVPQRFRQLTLDNYVAKTDDQAAALSAVHRYLKRLADSVCLLIYLYGPSGTGKTELLSALFNSFAPSVPDIDDYSTAARLGTADNIAFVNGSDIPELVKGDKDNLRFQHLCECRFAVLDDLDKCPAGGWSSSLYKLIDNRICQNGLPTVISANCTPAALARRYEHGSAIVDRLQRYNTVFIRLGQKPVYVDVHPSGSGTQAIAPAEQISVPPSDVTAHDMSGTTSDPDADYGEDDNTDTEDYGENDQADYEGDDE